MSHKQAKRVRKILIPKKLVREAGAPSRGEFIRSLTEYKTHTPKIGNPYRRQMLQLDPECPRYMVQVRKYNLL